MPQLVGHDAGAEAAAVEERRPPSCGTCAAPPTRTPSPVAPDGSPVRCCSGPGNRPTRPGTPAPTRHPRDDAPPAQWPAGRGHPGRRDPRSAYADGGGLMSLAVLASITKDMAELAVNAGVSLT